MKKSNCTPEEVFSKLPWLSKDEFKLLWEDDHWDVPLCGMLRYKSENLYFMMHNEGMYYEDTDTWVPPSYTVHRLNPNIMDLEVKWHELFTELVGNHWTYGKEGKLTKEEFNTKEHLHCEDFYERKKKEYDPIEPDLDDPHVANLIARIQL